MDEEGLLIKKEKVNNPTQRCAKESPVTKERNKNDNHDIPDKLK